MIRRFAMLVAACAALACGGEQQDEAVESSASAAATTCREFGPGRECPYIPNVGCPTGYTHWNGEMCIKCYAPNVITHSGCIEPGTPGYWQMCAIPTPRPTLCAGKTGMVWDPQTCFDVDCDHCSTGLTECSDACVNAQTDVNNCGACGNKCTAQARGAYPASCSAGRCRTCTEGYGGSWTCTY